MLRVDLSNFCNIREAHFHEDKPFSLITGYNESGKSSFIGALQFAFTGSAFGLRGEGIAGLITDGEEKMHVRCQLGTMNVNRTASSGDALKGVAERLQVPSDVMPLLFDSQLCGDGGNKSMRAFLDGVASSKFDALSHFATDPIVSECVNASRRSGKVTTKQIIAYCESLRAMQKDPAMPVMPTVTNPSDTEIVKATAAAESGNASLVEAVKAHADNEKTGAQLLQITQNLHSMASYEVAKAAATLNDSLGSTRGKLERAANINTNSLQAVLNILNDLPVFDASLAATKTSFEAAFRDVSTLLIWVKNYLTLHPAPAAAPVLPLLPAEAHALYDDLKASNLLNTDSIAAMCLAVRDESRQTLELKEKAAALVQTLRGIRDDLLRQQGAWKAYTASLPEYETAKAKSASDWKMWDDASKLISAAEIDHINKAGDAFGSLVSDFSAYVLQGRKVSINRDTGISLGGRSIERCSVSTRWRIEVSVMAAIARTLKSPILLIDAADVLDDRNKATMQEFLLERIVPHFQHVIVTSTCRGKLEDVKASQEPRVSKWIMANGELSKLVAG